MECWIYKGEKRLDTYLYLDRKDDFSMIPEDLLIVFGCLEQVMKLDIQPDTNLARADAKTVLETIKSQGFYMQLPPRHEQSEWITQT